MSGGDAASSGIPHPPSPATAMKANGESLLVYVVPPGVQDSLFEYDIFKGHLIAFTNCLSVHLRLLRPPAQTKYLERTSHSLRNSLALP
jgi:hypothetical protein